MGIATGPTAIVAADVEHLWDLIITPARVAEWTDAPLVSAPRPVMEPGDRVMFSAGPGLGVTFRVLRAERPSTLAVDVDLPFGIVNHEVITLRSAEGGCRVTFG